MRKKQGQSDIIIMKTERPFPPNAECLCKNMLIYGSVSPYFYHNRKCPSYSLADEKWCIEYTERANILLMPTPIPSWLDPTPIVAEEAKLA